jgi:hypothetical protein
MPDDPRTWALPAEPDDCTAVRDRRGQLWLAPGRPGNNLWWRGRLGNGTGYEWHELLFAAGPLTADTSQGES